MDWHSKWVESVYFQAHTTNLYDFIYYECYSTYIYLKFLVFILWIWFEENEQQNLIEMKNSKIKISKNYYLWT